MNKKLRIGLGYDVHQLKKDRDLILGGVKIESPLGLDGHSDADVLIHAIMDSILGALAKGDIGKLFPDTDDTYKDISSLKLLAKVKEICSKEGYEIENIDSVVIAQEPKLAPYIVQMRENIANVLEIEIDQVGVKATTEEKLGFTGRQEGIAAQANVLLKLKERIMIGIITAIDEEYDSVKRLIANPIVRKSELAETTVGKIGDSSVVLAKSGQGKVNAACCAQMLIDRYLVDNMINIGIAGGLAEDLGIGEVVISKDTIQYDFDERGLGLQIGEIPDINIINFIADQELVDMATKAADEFDINYRVGRVLTGDTFINNEKLKETLINIFDGTVCEMEGAAIAQVCYLNNIPFLLIRSVSDNASESAAKQVIENAKAVENTSKILEDVVKNIYNDKFSY